MVPVLAVTGFESTEVGPNGIALRHPQLVRLCGIGGEIQADKVLLALYRAGLTDVAGATEKKDEPYEQKPGGFLAE